MLKYARPGSVFLLNSIYGPDKVWDTLPKEMQKSLIDKKIRFYVIDAYDVAEKAGMGNRINTIMQTCFFAISGVLPRAEAIDAIKHSIYKTYHKKAMRSSSKTTTQWMPPLKICTKSSCPPRLLPLLAVNQAYQRKLPSMYARLWAPLSTSKAMMFQSAKCLMTAPSQPPLPSGRNATLPWKFQSGTRSFVSNAPNVPLFARMLPSAPRFIQMRCLKKLPRPFKHVFSKSGNWKEGYSWTVQVAPEDCTGCGLCVENCPGKDKTDPNIHAIMLNPQPPLREQEAENFRFFLDIPHL